MISPSFCEYCGAENVSESITCCYCQRPLNEAIGTPSEASGTLLNGRYTILGEIGVGGFGAVYKALDMRENGRAVAVKQINLKGLSPQEIIEATDAFNREAEILPTLDHPLLPRIFDRFSDSEHWYLVMNFIDGSTLDEYLQHRTRSLSTFTGLPLVETLRIALQLCDVLHYLHTRQPAVIFRDLKPGNIMRTHAGKLYLIDFGIVRHFKPGQIKDTMPFGSPGFAAPEQYGRTQTTPRSDVYSLGALLSYLISGDDPSEHPFDFPALRVYGVDGIRELNALIQRMVALDPAQRPADILEVQAELRSIQQVNTQVNRQSRIWTPPQGQTPPSTGGRQQQVFLSPSNTRPIGKITRRGVITVSLIVGSVALVGGFATFMGNPPHYRFAHGHPFPDQRPSANTVSGYSYWSADLSLDAGFGDAGQVYIYNEQRSNLLQTIPSTGPSLDLQWSPDDSQILVFTGKASGDVWDVASGQIVFSITPVEPTLSDLSMVAAWSPDGQYLAAGISSPQGTVFTLFQGATGNQLSQQIFPGQAATSVTWMPDGHSILFPVSNDPDAPSSDVWSFEIWDSLTQLRTGLITNPVSSDLRTSQSISLLTVSSLTEQVAFASGTSIWLGDLRKAGSIHKFADIGNIDAPDGGGSPSMLIWSPDEVHLGLLKAGNLIILNASDGTLDALFGASFPQGHIEAFVWAADSRSITVVDNSATLTQVSIY